MEYSHKDFTGRNLTECDFSGVEIICGSCFSQENPDTVVFPDNMAGVTFRNCNLMNVFIPQGNTVINCQTDRFKVQNDLNDWLIDEKNVPLTVVDYIHFYKNKIPHPNPMDIPDEPVSERIDYERRT